MKREAAETQQARQEAEQLSDSPIELFRESDRNRTQGREPTARDLLAGGREWLEPEPLLDQPLTRARLSRTIGDVYADLGDFAEAEPLLLSAFRLLEQETGERNAGVAETLDLGKMKTKAGFIRCRKPLVNGRGRSRRLRETPSRGSGRSLSIISAL